MGGAEAEALRTAFSSSNFWSGISTIVAVGLFVELAVLLFFSKATPRSEWVLLLLATLLILIGVVGEYEFGSKAAQLSEKAVADAQRDAKQAEQRAEEANLALAQFKAPRAISPEQRDCIVEKMKEFAGQEYTGMIGSGVVDAQELWREIGLSLDLAGWKNWCCVSRPIDRLYGHEATIWQAPVGGVHIFWPTLGPNDLSRPLEEQRAKALKADGMRPPAQALAEALTAEGLPAFSGPMIDINNHPVVVISIGPKPQK